MFLEILQNSQENTCARVYFLTKLQPWGSGTGYRCFPVNFAKFLRTYFIIEQLWWLLLIILTISAVQVFSPEPISTVVWFSRIFSITLGTSIFRNTWERLLFIFYCNVSSKNLHSLFLCFFQKIRRPVLVSYKLSTSNSNWIVIQ